MLTSHLSCSKGKFVQDGETLFVSVWLFGLRLDFCSSSRRYVEVRLKILKTESFVILAIWQVRSCIVLHLTALRFIVVAIFVYRKLALLTYINLKSL